MPVTSQTPVSGSQTTTKEAISEWAGDATLHTMQKIPLLGRLACCPVLHGPSPPLWHPLQLSLSPPSAIPPEPVHCRDSYYVTGEGTEGRAGSPLLEVVWRWGRAWWSLAWAGEVGEEGRRLGRPQGRCSKGCLLLVAQGWQKRVEANIPHSDRTLWAAVVAEVWERQGGSRLPPSGRSTQRRWRGPLGTRSGDGSEEGARGRLSDD